MALLYTTREKRRKYTSGGLQQQDKIWVWTAILAAKGSKGVGQANEVRDWWGWAKIEEYTLWKT